MAESVNRPPSSDRMNASRDYFAGLIAEMRRVTWPSRPEWVGATLLTIALVVAVALFTSACDQVFAFVTSKLYAFAHGGR